MVSDNRETFRTDFQVSVDAVRGITTGISAADRAKTIAVMASPTATPRKVIVPPFQIKSAPSTRSLFGAANAGQFVESAMSPTMRKALIDQLIF